MLGVITFVTKLLRKGFPHLHNYFPDCGKSLCPIPLLRQDTVIVAYLTWPSKHISYKIAFIGILSFFGIASHFLAAQVLLDNIMFVVVELIDYYN